MAKEGMTIKLEGVDELIKMLGAVSDDIAKDLAKCIRKGGEIIKEAAKDNIRAQRLTDTWALHDNFSMNTVEKDRSQVEVVVGPGKKEFYGMFYEYGFKTRDLEARPFLRPAYDENIDKVQEVIAEELLKTIERRSRGK